MFKLTDPNDLEKAGRSMASFLAKQAEQLEKDIAYFTSEAEQSEAMSKAFAALAKDNKDAHDAKDNDDDSKAAHGKAAESFKALSASLEARAKSERARAEVAKADLDSLKGVVAEWGGTTAAITHKAAAGANAVAAAAGAPVSNIEQMLDETKMALVQKAREMMNNDPDTLNFIKAAIVQEVQRALGNDIRPDSVKSVIPAAPAAYGSGLTAVTRPGQPPMQTKPNVSLQFEHLIKVDDEG
jgi:hypothetical protein